METPLAYTPITPDKVFLPYFRREPTEAELWKGFSRNEYGNQPCGCKFIDCFAGIIRRSGYTDVISISRKMGIDRISLQYTIMTLTGITPKAWIDYWLLTTICEILEKTDWPIKKIAEKLNFTSQGVLSTYFTKHKKIAPTEWRMQNSGKNKD